MIIEVATYCCIKEGKGIINIPNFNSIYLRNIEGKLFYPLLLNKANNFEHSNPAIEISGYYDKQLFLQDSKLVDLITNKINFEVIITKNDLKDFFNIKILKNTKISSISLAEGKIFITSYDFIEA